MGFKSHSLYNEASTPYDLSNNLTQLFNFPLLPLKLSLHFNPDHILDPDLSHGHCSLFLHILGFLGL